MDDVVGSQAYSPLSHTLADSPMLHDYESYKDWVTTVLQQHHLS